MAESKNISGTVAAIMSVSKPATAISRGHISIFYPALIILDIYACAWALLIAQGFHGTPVVKIMAIVCFVVVPMLTIYALIRFLTVSVVLAEKEVLIRRGWPHMGVCTIAHDDLSEAHASFSYFGKMIGAGALSITTCDGTTYRVRDITSPDQMAERLNDTVLALLERSKSKAWTTYRIGPGVRAPNGQQVTSARLSPGLFGSMPEAEASTTSMRSTA